MLDYTKIKTQWDLSPLLKPETQAEIDLRINEASDKWADFEQKWVKSFDWLKNPKKVKKALADLNTIFESTEITNNTSTYFLLKQSLNESDSKVKAQLNKIEDATRNNALIFQNFINQLSKASEVIQKNLLESEDLAEYRQLLRDCFESGKYILSEEAEKVLMFTSNVSYGNWVHMTSEFLASEEAETLTKEGKKTKNYSELFTLISNPNKAIRTDAAKNIDKILDKYSKVAEVEINSVLEYKKILDLLRGYKQSDEAFSVLNKISLPIIDTVIDSVSSQNKLVHDYYKMRAKLIGQDKIKYFERNVQYGKFSKEYDFNEAVGLVDKTFSALDPQFHEILENFLYNGQLDVFPKKGKNAGAFMCPVGKYKPSYVLLNHDQKLEDVLTLAHEMGHAIHHELVHQTQPGLYSSTSLCFDETASTFFESFAVDKISHEIDDETRLALLIRELDNAVGAVFRQTACFKFERELHTSYRSEGYLPKERIGEIFLQNMSAYCGPTVEMHEDANLWWVYWPHIRDFFYVFSYTFGYLISKNLQALVKKDPANIERVKKFLAAGSSRTPEDILLDVDIDITKKEFWKKSVTEIEKVMNEAQGLARKLGKI